MKKTYQDFPASFVCLFFIISAVIICSRRIDIIVNPQLWAEDGAIWLSTIYNQGFWAGFLAPQNGYYQTISRCSYGLGLLFGLQYAPLVATVIAITIRCSIVAFWMSKRFDFIDIKYRLLLTFYFLFMPNLAEGYVNITNAHWYLSLYLLSVLLANPASSFRGKFHDMSVLLLSALSGPFIIFIAPCLAIKRYYERGGIAASLKKIDLFDIVLVICFFVQLFAILTTATGTRSTAALGASIFGLFEILQNRVFLGSLFDISLVLSWKPEHITTIVFVLLNLAAILYFAFAGSWRVKISIIFPVLMLSFALAKPMISNTQPQWPPMINTAEGERYFYVPDIFYFAFLLLIVSNLRNSKKIENFILLSVTVIFLYIFPNYFFIYPHPNFHYKEQIIQFEKLPSGGKMDIAITPPGWYMHLIKK